MAGNRAGQVGVEADFDSDGVGDVDQVVGEDVAGSEDAGDLVLGAAAPGLGHYYDRHDGADTRGRQFVVQGQEVRVAAFGCQQCAGVVDDSGHLSRGLLRLAVV